MVTWPSAASNFEFVWPEREECLKVAYCLTTLILGRSSKV